ncbi:hypothetical protein BH10PLA2_BH10PLA2_39570 [soil metagenome]
MRLEDVVGREAAKTIRQMAALKAIANPKPKPKPKRPPKRK